ncbi:hypothetical protein OE88DRAFT_4991 [Heliocybe sulcata]|uniref:Uncharacterized protein n=1 Tax=Heliocybe sulcata TaxID=5364 RepID=A0A5C3NRL8_9AGAM|nr:hypothetical protein OE88DRAFT_4991 [Heliocybe sulcata]
MQQPIEVVAKEGRGVTVSGAHPVLYSSGHASDSGSLRLMWWTTALAASATPTRSWGTDPNPIAAACQTYSDVGRPGSAIVSARPRTLPPEPSTCLLLWHTFLLLPVPINSLPGRRRRGANAKPLHRPRPRSHLTRLTPRRTPPTVLRHAVLPLDTGERPRRMQHLLRTSLPILVPPAPRANTRIRTDLARGERSRRRNLDAQRGHRRHSVLFRYSNHRRPRRRLVRCDLDAHPASIGILHSQARRNCRLLLGLRSNPK